MKVPPTDSRAAYDKKQSPILVTLIGLLVAYMPQYIHKILGLLRVQLGPEGPPSVILWNWLSVVLLTAYIIVIERKSLASILLVRPKIKDLIWACIFWVMATSWNWGMNIVVAPQAQNEGLGTIIQLPIPVIIGMIFTTAITEEILYRGYPIERLRELTGNAWVGVSFSLIVFLLPHIRFFGVQWLLYHGVGTILTYILYMWRRNLWACILMHFLGNAPLLLPALGMG
jgi:membrane protease YdiL (CAAX protease family)